MALITTVIPTYNRAQTLQQRAVPSVARQTLDDWECIIVGDGTDHDTEYYAEQLCRDDDRFRFWNLPHADYPANDLRGKWKIQGTIAFGFGLEKATGDWISYLADDDEYAPDHHATLLSHSRNADVVCAKSRVDQTLIGEGPPGPTCCVQGAYIMRRSLGLRPRTTSQAWPWDCHWWMDAIEAGARFRFIDDVVHRYWPARETQIFHGTGL